MIKNVPKPISGGLILSYKCSAACRHCIYACSQKWDSNWISHEDLEKILGQLSGKILSSPYGPNTISLNYGLHFTGGEPFLNFELLCKAVEIANRFKIPSTFVETNCFRAVDDKTTRKKLKLLKKKGMRGIMISVNPFYLEYVPFERTEMAIKASLDIFGNNVAVYQLEYYRRFKEREIRGKVSFEDYMRLEKKDDFLRNIEFLLMGRAPYRLKDTLEKFIPRYSALQLFNQPCTPSFIRPLHNHFDNFGNYVPGFCAGVSFGDCRELDRLLKEGIDTEQYPVLGYLMDEDFEGLFALAEEMGYMESQYGYFSKCHLCMEIRRHLVSKDEFKELRPKEFYQHLE